MAEELPDWQEELAQELAALDDGDVDALRELLGELDLPEPDPEVLGVGIRSTGPWTVAEVVERMRDGGYTGLDIFGGCGLELANLEFLADLPPLTKLGVEIKVGNDLAAFALAGLVELALVTNCRRPVPDCLLPDLRRLVLTERPGIEADRWPSLEVLRLGRWRSGDVDFLAGATALREVELEGARQRVSLDAVADCRALVSFRTRGAVVDDLSPLAGLPALRELRLPTGTAQHGDLDLAALGHLPALEMLWLGEAERLRNLGHLATLPALRELRVVRGTPGAGPEELAALPDTVAVTVVR